MTAQDRTPAGMGKFVLNSRLPDDFGDMYAPFAGPTFMDDFGGMRGGAFVWPQWLASRRHFYHGWVEEV